MGIEITLEGQKDLEKIRKYIQKVQKKISGQDSTSLEDLKIKLLEVLNKDLEQRFQSSPSTTSGGTVYGGEYWKPLSESYLASRPDREAGRIYIDTTRLQQSLSSNNSETIFDLDSSFNFRFGTRVPYAEKLQKYRPIVFWHQDLIDKIVRVYEDWIFENE